MRYWLSRVAVVVILALMLPLASLVSAASAFASLAFEQQWNAGEAVTPNFWGPLSLAHDGQQESYKEAAGGMRLVQYFDKARMELTNQGGPVTNGLLTVELMTGRVQLGDATFEQQQSVRINVAGDPGSDSITYADLAKLAYKPGRAYVCTSTPCTETEDTGNPIAPLFAGFVDKVGVAAVGLPVTSPFVMSIKVGGVAQQVWAQAFERRVLTLTGAPTPTDPLAYRIEFGNIGQHYYAWRYANNTPVAAVLPVTASPPNTPPPTVVPPVMANFQVIASVSNPTPTQNSRVTITAKLTNNGAGVAGATMNTTWNYKTTTSYCSGGPSGPDGMMSCTRDISRATVGFTVLIDVKVTYQGQTYTATASFTTR